MTTPAATSSHTDSTPGTHASSRDRLRSYITGLGFAILLTAASFWASSAHSIWGPSIPVLLAVLAIAQMGVHLVFFLHLSSSPDSANTILALAFGIFIVGLVIFGSMIIMFNLNHLMGSAPMDQMMDLQRQR